MSVDLRLFQYELEPVLQRLEWEKFRLTTELTMVINKKKVEQETYEIFEKQLHNLLHDTRSQLHRNFDLNVYQASLDFLSHLSEKLENQRQNLNRIDDEKKMISKKISALLLKQDVFEQHKDESKLAYVRIALAKKSAELDREWSSRAIWSLTSKSAMEE